MQGDRHSKASPLMFWLCDQLAHKLGGHPNIKTREELGIRYIVHIKMSPYDQRAGSEECLLDDVCVMVDITSNDVRSIILRQLENWGATCTTPNERLNG